MGNCYPSSGKEGKLTIINETPLNIDNVEIKSCGHQFRGSLLEEHMLDYENIAEKVEETDYVKMLSSGFSWQVKFTIAESQCFFGTISLEFQDGTKDILVVFVSKDRKDVIKKCGIRNFTTQVRNYDIEVRISQSQEEIMREQRAREQREDNLQREQQQKEERQNAKFEEAASTIIEEGENLTRQGNFKEAAKLFEKAKRWARSERAKQRLFQNIQRTTTAIEASEITEQAWNDEFEERDHAARAGFEVAQEMFRQAGFPGAHGIDAKIEADSLFNEGIDLLERGKEAAGLRKLQQSKLKYEDGLQGDSRIQKSIDMLNEVTESYQQKHKKEQSNGLRVKANRNRATTDSQTSFSFNR